MSTRPFSAITFCVMIFSSAPLNATLYSLEWSLSDGEPLILGIVDTEQDLLKINHWSDRDLTPTSDHFAWTPDLTNASVFPANEWHMYAYQANGEIFDIPNNWDGNIGVDWGFISSIDLDSIPWNQGSRNYTGPSILDVIYPGFGGFKNGAFGLTGPADGGNSVGTTGTNGGPAMLNFIMLDESGDVFQASGAFQVEPLPIPSAIWLFGSGLLGLIGITRRNLRIRN